VLNKDQYNQTEWKTMQTNLEKILKMKIPIRLRYTLLSPSEDCSHVFDTAEKYGLKEITIGTASPGAKKTNSFVRKEQLPEFKNKIIELCERARKQGIKCDIGATLPICMFTQEEKTFLRDFNLNFVCTKECFNPALIIRPDLSFQMCFFLPMDGTNICDFRSIQDARLQFKEKFEKIKWTPLYSKCTFCVHFIRKKCQGSCLSYKL